jgi:hypothetical protein
VIAAVHAAATNVCDILAPGRGEELHRCYLDEQQSEGKLLQRALEVIEGSPSSSPEYRTAVALLASSMTNRTLAECGIGKRQAKSGRDDLTSINETGKLVVRRRKEARGSQKLRPFVLSECVKFIMDPKNTRQVTLRRRALN